MQSEGFRLGRDKRKYLECKFSDIAHVVDIEIRIETQVIPKKESFKYPR